MEQDLDIKTQFEQLLGQAAQEFANQFRVDAAAIAQDAAERTTHLSTLVGQPGFERAVVAERDNIALRAGIQAAQTGDAVDQRVLGLLQGGLQVGANALAALAGKAAG